MQRYVLCRSRRELSNDYLFAKFGFDTTENEPCKDCPLSAYRSPRFIEDFDKDAAKAMKDEDLDMDFTPSPYTFWAQGDVDAKQRWTEVRDVVRKGGSLLRTITKNAEERRDGSVKEANE